MFPGAEDGASGGEEEAPEEGAIIDFGTKTAAVPTK